MKILKDRFTLGFVAGVIALIPSFIWNHLSKSYFRFSDLTFVDFTSVLIYGKLPKSMSKYIFAVFGLFFWNGLLGVIFAFLLKLIESKNLIFKGWCYGNSVWFFSYVITRLFKIPEFKKISLNSSISNVIGATLQGISLGYTLKYFNKKLV